MVNLYVYLAIVIIIIWLTADSMQTSFKYSPPKIKLLSMLGMGGLLLRELSLLILFFFQSSNYLYLLKPVVFLNFLCIPVILMICTYIFMRSNNIKFSYVIIISGVLLIAYGVIIFKMPIIVQLSSNYGYVINFLNELGVSFGLIAACTIITVICILQTGKAVVNSIGLYSVLVTALLCIGETILKLIGLEPLPQLVLGDLFSMITLSFAIKKMKF